MAEVNFDSIEPCVGHVAGPVHECRGDPGDLLLACGERAPHGEGVEDRVGPMLGRPVAAGLATKPAWPICADTSAPSAWTASASRVRPGTASCRKSSVLPSVLPSGETAQ